MCDRTQKPASEQRFTLPRQARLRRRADFTVCYEQGLRCHSRHFLVFLHTADKSPASQDSPPRTGVAVSRKVGNAVTRNRIKRLLREFFRLNPASIPGGADIAAIAKKHAGQANLNLAQVSAELVPLFQYAAKHQKI